MEEIPMMDLKIRTGDLYVHSDSKNMSWRLSFSSNLNSDIYVKKTNTKDPKPKERKKSSPPQTF